MLRNSEPQPKLTLSYKKKYVYVYRNKAVPVILSGKSNKLMMTKSCTTKIIMKLLYYDIIDYNHNNEKVPGSLGTVVILPSSAKLQLQLAEFELYSQLFSATQPATQPTGKVLPSLVEWS